MATVYLVLSDHGHEGCSPVKAFESEADAKAFVAEIAAYNETRPQQPEDTGDEEKDNRRFDRYWRKWERWNKAHPAGDGYGDCYPIMPIELVPTPKEPK